MTFELPVFVMVTLCEGELVPVVTLPKLKLAGLILRVSVAATPVPVRLTAVGEVGALLTMEIEPEMAPTVVGKNATVIVVWAPAFTVMGNE